MVTQLSIKNFKSIKDIEIPCKKINVFIGEPNGGKSNIIESLSLLSQGVVGAEISKEVLRYNSIGDLFFDFNINKPIEVKADEMAYTFTYAIRPDGVPENEFSFDITFPKGVNPVKTSTLLKVSHDGKLSNYGQLISTNIRYYQYKRLSKFTLGYQPHLTAPFGENLPSLLLSNEDYRKWVSEFFQSKGFKLTLKPAENEINISKVVNDEIYSYPYLSISETLQRIVFYIMAIKSSSNSILLLDEPETNTFPFYTKFLAERIALDETNQFFLTTHNPYLLLGLIEKSTFENINVCVVTMKDYQTKITTLNSEQVAEVLDFNSDVFFNLARIINEL